MDAELPPVGSTFAARYALESVLGKGAFGTTYRARDLKLESLRAIKIFPAGDEESFQALRKEASVASRLVHPNIKRVLDVGRSEASFPYLVTEWVDGSDLGTVLRNSGKLGQRNAVEVCTAIAQALAYAHEQNFIHRDLKPSNVLIPGWPGAAEFSRAQLLDFGIAGVLSSRTFSGDLQTQPGMVFGTPLYMSPEQVRGQPQSAATDVYGLGLLLFEMLAGHPLRGRKSSSLGDVLREIVVDELPNKELAAIPAGVAEIIAACLRSDPRQRPAIDGVIADLIGPAPAPPAPAPPAPAPPSPAIFEVGAATGAVLLPAPASAAAVSYRKHLPWVTVIAVSAAFLLVVVAVVALRSGGARVIAVLAGVALIAAGIGAGFWLRDWLGRRRSELGAEALDLALGAKRHIDVTGTLALQVEELISSLRTIDERILAGSVALMLDEYRHAGEARDRQSALMNVVTLSEKLAQRLSPWYVRYKDVIASAVAVAGAISGAITAYAGLRGH